MENLKKYNIVLASNSPRRKELLAGLDVPFTVRTLQGVDESYPAGLSAEEIPLYIAQAKAKAYRATMGERDLIITADTIVWIDGEVLGKPHDGEDARRMLRMLSGNTHQVITGVSITTQQQQHCFSVVSHVTFAQLTEEEITYYIEHYRPFDKAGAYGIQEWIGYIGVTRLEGSYFNVMGLPVQRLYQELMKL
jgi:septum formation protein